MDNEDFVMEGFPTNSVSALESSLGTDHNSFSSETEDLIPGQYMPTYSGIFSDSLLLTAKVGTLFFDGFNRIYATMDNMMIGLSFWINKSAQFIVRGLSKLFRLPSLYEKIDVCMPTLQHMKSFCGRYSGTWSPTWTVICNSS